MKWSSRQHYPFLSRDALEYFWLHMNFMMVLHFCKEQYMYFDSIALKSAHCLWWRTATTDNLQHNSWIQGPGSSEKMDQKTVRAKELGLLL